MFHVKQFYLAQDQSFAFRHSKSISRGARVCSTGLQVQENARFEAFGSSRDCKLMVGDGLDGHAGAMAAAVEWLSVSDTAHRAIAKVLNFEAAKNKTLASAIARISANQA